MKRLSNKRGQAILEMLFVIILVTGIWTAITTSLSKKGTFNAMFGEPWIRLKNTVEYGIPTDKTNLMNQHPAHVNRHSTRTVQR